MGQDGELDRGDLAGVLPPELPGFLKAILEDGACQPLSSQRKDFDLACRALPDIARRAKK